MGDRVRRTHAIRHRALGLLTGLAVGCVTVLAPGGYALGAPADDVPSVDLNSSIGKAVLPHSKLPNNAVLAKHAAPTPGPQGALFQSPGAGRAGSTRIVGGVVANASAFPSVVGIETFFFAYDENDEIVRYVSYCTGTVISSTKILTAGHCNTDLPFGTTFVIAGRNDLDLNTGGYVARVSSTWTDQNFNLAALNAGTTLVPVDDVSVLTLRDPLPAAYPPIALTAQGDQTAYTAGNTATIVGYGVTSNANADPGVLHQATVPIQSNTTCLNAVSGYDSNRMICAGNPNLGIDSCHGDSGGPLIVSGVQVGITDWGIGDCGASYGVYERLSYYSNAVKADLTRPRLVNLDWTGDGHSDLMARDTNGNLIAMSGSGFANNGYGGFSGSLAIGHGWNGYSKLFRVTDWNSDDAESVMAVTPSGNLYQYRGDGAGDFLPPKTALQIGNGWNMFSDIMVVNNWTGDGRPNLMGRTPAGDLYLYTSDGNGGWLNGGAGIKIGNGWGMFNTVLTPGTWTGDGHQTLIGRTPAGDLYLYTSDGKGGWLNGGAGIRIGNGWNMFSVFMSPGDWNGDNMIDLIGVTPAGEVKLYTTDGHGNWLDSLGKQIDTGWNIFNAVF